MKKSQNAPEDALMIFKKEAKIDLVFSHKLLPVMFSPLSKLEQEIFLNLNARLYINYYLNSS